MFSSVGYDRDPSTYRTPGSAARSRNRLVGIGPAAIEGRSSGDGITVQAMNPTASRSDTGPLNITVTDTVLVVSPAAKVRVVGATAT